MVKKTVFFLLVTAMLVSVFAFEKKPLYKSDAEGISFIEQDWKQALQQAKASHKPVFLDVYASWCGPCKLLKKNTFSDKAVAEFFNKNFINVSVDGEKGVGPTLMQQYAITAYPTLIVADETGKPMLFTMGYLDTKTLLAFGKEALKKAQP